MAQAKRVLSYDVLRTCVKKCDYGDGFCFERVSQSEEGKKTS